MKSNGMKKRLLFFSILCIPFFSFLEAQQLIGILKSTGIDSINEIQINIRRYENAFEAFVTQPLDHKNHENGFFMQRLFIRHRGFDKPVVYVTEGYAADYARRPHYDEELAEALDANLIVVEHRFFGKSLPKTMDWRQLNLYNAASDLHAINQLLKKVYTGAWLSTGISKGGQTTIYYRYFYPDDVKASVPYVAPLNFAEADKRVYHFLDTVSDLSCRKNLMELQKNLLERKDVFLPMFADSAQARKLSFKRIGGVEKAFEYNVLELGFAYWQWYPIPCDELPQEDGPTDAIFNAFIAAAGYDFFADQSIDVFQPFFYQALTEMGFYSYQTKPFQELLSLPSALNFHHSLPNGVEAKYKARLSKKVNRWIQRNGNNFLYIYGGYDAWSSTAVQPGKKTNAIKLVLPKGSHSTRLRHFDVETSQAAINQLKDWLEL
jgi:hypothetical protein